MKYSFRNHSSSVQLRKSCVEISVEELFHLKLEISRTENLTGILVFALIDETNGENHGITLRGVIAG